LGTTSTLSKTTGTVIVAGGVGVSGNIHALHANFEDVEADSVTVTDTTTSTSATTGALKVVGGISTQENLNVGANVHVDGDTLVVDASTDRVGINKAVPAYALDVVGDINFTGTFREDGVAFAGSPWNIETSPDAVNYTAGNVGIGIADPAANLHVNGDVLITGGLITNSGGLGRKTYSLSNSMPASVSPTTNIHFTSNIFHAKITATLVDRNEHVSTILLDVNGGSQAGSINSGSNVISVGSQTIFGTTDNATPWASNVSTTANTVALYTSGAMAVSGNVHVFVEYMSPTSGGGVHAIAHNGDALATFGY
jgi:hypothetical protein